MTYGPEAFADPPIAAGEIEDSVVSSTFVAGLLFGLVLVAALPLVVWLARDWLNVADLWFLLFAWFVIVASLIWLLVARRRAREYDRAPPPQMTNQQVLGTATHDPGNRTASHLPSDTHPPARE